MFSLAKGQFLTTAFGWGGPLNQRPVAFFLALTFARAFNTLLLPHRLSDISLSFVLFN